MAEPNLEVGLRTLRRSLRQIRALLAWEQLKQSEARPGEPLAFQIDDPIETDLRNEYSFFLSTSVQIHNILNDESVRISQAKRQHLKQELAKIERRVHGLSLPERLY